MGRSIVMGPTTAHWRPRFGALVMAFIRRRAWPRLPDDQRRRRSVGLGRRDARVFSARPAAKLVCASQSRRNPAGRHAVHARQCSDADHMRPQIFSSEAERPFVDERSGLIDLGFAFGSVIRMVSLLGERINKNLDHRSCPLLASTHTILPSTGWWLGLTLVSQSLSLKLAFSANLYFR